MLTYKQRYRPRTTREYTKSDLTVYDSAGNTALNALTVYGKSEVVDGVIKSAGEGYAVVRLADLKWQLYQNRFFATNLRNTISPYVSPNTIPNILSNKYRTMSMNGLAVTDKSISVDNGNDIEIKDLGYTAVSDFVTSLGDATLCYQLADPTQGNAIAIKTDNGTGINGTMATFTTGTPLRGIPDSNVRDVMVWDGSAGEVTKNCAGVDLGTLYWTKSGDFYYTNVLINLIKPPQDNDTKAKMICGKYSTEARNELHDKTIVCTFTGVVAIMDTDYSDVTAFTTAMSGVMLIYELATPTTEQLTTAENESIAALRTFDGTTHFTNNADTDMTVNYTIKVPTI